MTNEVQLKLFDVIPCCLEEIVKEAKELIRSYTRARCENTKRSYSGVLDAWEAWAEARDREREREATTKREQDKRHWLSLVYKKPVEEMRACTFLDVDMRAAQDYFEHLLEKEGRLSRDRRTSKLASGTVLRTMAILRKFYSELIEGDIYKGKNPFNFKLPKMSTEPSKRPTQALSEVQVERILKAFPGDDYNSTMDRALVHLLFGLGLRRGEPIAFKIADVLFDSQEIVIRDHQKSGRVDTLTLPPWAWETLMKYMAFRRDAAPHELLFVRKVGGYRGTPVCDKPLGYNYPARRFDAACKYAGISKGGYSCHSARATAITQLYDRGAQTRDIQPFARHATGAMTERYDKRKKNQLRKIANMLDYTPQKIAS